MLIEIDQSWKIEDTQKPTIIAFSNSKNDAIIISAREKKIIQEYFRNIGKPRLFAILCFTVLVFLLVRKEIKSGDHLEIDCEYPGYEKFIKLKLNTLITDNTKVKDINISTTLIGKKSKAHIIAYSGFKNRSKVEIKKISAREVIDIIKKI